jgi:hypothetical protein
MTQNKSHAVMQQRHEPDDSLDDFPTQPWGTRGLIVHVIKPLGVPMRLAWEPACNRGYMVRPLREYFHDVHASDVFDYSDQWPEGIVVFGPDGRPRIDDGQERVCDFLFPNSEPQHIEKNPVDWIITNPPFRLAEQFIWRARNLARVGCAMLVRTSFLESVGRYERLFSVTPPTIVAQFVERLPMVKGRVDRKASTATSYAWLVWLRDASPRPFQWIPPCRSKLERDTDYPEAA